MERTDYELIIVGAGPVGLACAIAAQRAGIEYVALERGCVVNSVFRFPTQMTFFTTPELMEIGEHPLVAGPFGKPTRSEALDYYRGVTRAEDLNVRTYEDVHSVEGEKGAFRVSATHKGRTRDFTSELVVLATGYYDCPNYLGIPGEDLPHVNHYYTEAHPHSGQKVLVVGGANSACVSSLDLYRRGADVTLVHRGDRFADGVKYWVRPDIENRIKAGEVRGFFETTIREIKQESAIFESRDGTRFEEPFDAVFLLTGYHPDPEFLTRCGLQPDPESLVLSLHPDTLESRDKDGIYLAGSVSAGHHTGMVFIENGRHDCEKIFEHITARS